MNACAYMCANVVSIFSFIFFFSVLLICLSRVCLGELVQAKLAIYGL